MKELIVNADDFGFTRGVNEGIVEAHRNGILTATTLMANGPAFEDAVRLARLTPTLDVGCHLVLIGGRSVLPPHAPLPSGVPQLLAAIALRRIRIHEELEAQVRKILDAGIVPTHLDTHKHTHLAPPVLEAVGGISRDHGIRWVRRPFDFPMTTPVSWSKRSVSNGLRSLRGWFHGALERYGCRTTDHFAGFQLTGAFRTRELIELICALPEGLTEFMCHPGHCDEELRRAPTRLKESREHELEALTSAETREALGRCGVALAHYR